MYKRYYQVFGIIGIVLVVGWHVADEIGMSKETKLRSAYFIFGFIVFMCAVQLVRAIYLGIAGRPGDTKTEPPDVKENGPK